MMTGDKFRSIRKSLDMTQAQLACAFEMGANGDRTIRRWETGETAVPSMAAFRITALEKQRSTDQSNLRTSRKYHRATAQT